MSPAEWNIASRYQLYVIGGARADDYYRGKVGVRLKVVVLRDSEQHSFMPTVDATGAIQMPLYTAITEEGAVSVETKTRIAEEITRIHTTVMKVPKNFVRVVFLSYPKGSGFTGGVQAPTASLNCVLRSGHTLEEKADMLRQLWTIFQGITGIATDQLALSLQEIPSSNAMEMGQIMQAVGHE